MNQDKNVIHSKDVQRVFDCSQPTAWRKMQKVKQKVWQENGFDENEGRQKRDFITASEFANYYAFDNSLISTLKDMGFKV